MTKVCTQCEKDEGLVSFEPQRRQCKNCRRAYCLEKRKEYYQANKDKVLLDFKIWREANRDKHLQRVKKSRDANKDKYAVYNRAYWSKRNAAKLQRTPLWLDENAQWMIKETYELAVLRSKITGIKWEVDHIIPLQGKMVSGLHVPTNLRVILASENRAKSNIF